MLLVVGEHVAVEVGELDVLDDLPPVVLAVLLVPKGAQVLVLGLEVAALP